jgi:hypothetical protein
MSLIVMSPQPIVILAVNDRELTNARLLHPHYCSDQGVLGLYVRGRLRNLVDELVHATFSSSATQSHLSDYTHEATLFVYDRVRRKVVVRKQRRCVSQSVVLCNRKDRMLAQNTALYCCCDGCGDYNPCEHRLIQIADYFLNSKSDGCDRGIESGRNSCCCSNRQESSEVLTRQCGSAA